MTLRFEKISNATPTSPSEELSRVFLSFDIDWACDEILADTIDLVEHAEVPATWFVTHDTPLLDRLRENPGFELGIHPNFNELLSGRSQSRVSPESILDELLVIVPEAKSVRSHSVTQNSRLIKLFADKGLTHDSNDFIPERAGLDLKAWRLWNGLIKVPYFWADEIDCLWEGGALMSDLVQRAGLKVFDFHPIHVFLNTASLELYEQTRDIHRVPEELIKHRYQGQGTRTALFNLLEASC